MLFTVLDILGYSELSRTKTTEEIVSIHQWCIASAFAGMDYTDVNAPQLSIFADTICVIPSDTNIQKYIHYLCLFMHNAILASDRGGAFFRGAVTSGEYFFDPAMTMEGIPIAPALLVGKPVIEAHEWEKAQKWIGCSFAPAALRASDQNLDEAIDLMIENKYLVRWDVPTSYGIEETVAINFVDERHAQALIEKLDALDAKENHPSIKAKVRATKRFIGHVSGNGLYPPLSRYQDLRTTLSVVAH